MGKYNRWRRKVRRQKIERVIHRLNRKTDSEVIRNRAIDILNDFQDYQARILTDAQPVEETLLTIQYQLLHLVSQEEIRQTTGAKKFKAQKMAYYEEKIWDLYSELKDLKERLHYLNIHSTKGKDRKALKKSIRLLEKRIKKLKKAYRKVRRSGLFGLFRKKDHSNDHILEVYSSEEDQEV
jgi:cob(I)alamin adenosyltransferase